MRQHIDMLGIAFLVYGGIQVLVALGLGLMMLGFGGLLGSIGASSGDEEALVVGAVYGVFGVVVAVFVGVFGVVYLLTGMGIRRRRGWARIAGIVTGVLALTSVPLGTLVGIYALVTLLDKEVAEEFLLEGAA